MVEISQSGSGEGSGWVTARPTLQRTFQAPRRHGSACDVGGMPRAARQKEDAGRKAPGYVGANKGLGALIIASQGMMDTPLMFAVFVVLTALGMVLYLLVHACERRVMIRRTRIEPVLSPEPLRTAYES